MTISFGPEFVSGPDGSIHLAHRGLVPWLDYHKVWTQDFTKMTTLAELGVSPLVMGSGNWIAHTPLNQDWFTFQDPGLDGHPFSIDAAGAGLTIRVQKDGHDPNDWFGGYSGGLLCSMDSTGKGFAQQYGYFEVSMKTPGGPNSWPAFWLLDAPSTVSPTTLWKGEVDIHESYGNFRTGAGQVPAGQPNMINRGWHRYRPSPDSRQEQTDGTVWIDVPTAVTEFHTYGVDIEPDVITYYIDRRVVAISEVPTEGNTATTFPEAARRMYIMLNLALGGGNYNNVGGTGYDWSLTGVSQDLNVKYVKVWASPASPNYLWR